MRVVGLVFAGMVVGALAADTIGPALSQQNRLADLADAIKAQEGPVGTWQMQVALPYIARINTATGHIDVCLLQATRDGKAACEEQTTIPPPIRYWGNQ